MEEKASLYHRLIDFINFKVPLLGEEIHVLKIDFTVTEIIVPFVFLILLNLLGNLVRSTLINRILGRYIEDRKTILSIGNIAKYSILIIGVSLLVAEIGLDYESELNFTIISANKEGEQPVKFFDLLKIIFYMALLVFAAAKFKAVFVKQVLSRYSEDKGVTQSIGTIVQYVILLIGGLLIIQNSGINLGSLNVLAGALGVGIGFGLQNIANNFISGLIILFERPIKVGDRIDVGTLSGDVVKISSRATTVNTNDNISYIIPNSDVINKQVVNWSFNDRNVRFRIPVGVSYKEDPEIIKKILLEVANKHSGILKRPEPDVWFVEYGESSLNFELVVWTNRYIDKPKILRSELYYEIFAQFKENNIEIPYPQRDLHLKSGFSPEKDASE